MAPLIIYHRGRHGPLGNGRVVVENSLASFEEAVRDGAAMIEFDVWTGLRVAHDPGAGASSPGLKDVLDVIAGRTAVNIEVKSPQAASDALIILKGELAAGRWRPQQIVLSSFHHETALRCKREFPDLTVGAIFDSVPLSSYIRELHSHGINNLHLNWANVYMDIENGSALRESARSLAMPIWVWTVNSREIFDTVVKYGASAVFTDRPDVMR